MSNTNGTSGAVNGTKNNIISSTIFPNLRTSEKDRDVERGEVTSSSPHVSSEIVIGVDYTSSEEVRATVEGEVSRGGTGGGGAGSTVFSPPPISSVRGSSISRVPESAGGGGSGSGRSDIVASGGVSGGSSSGGARSKVVVSLLRRLTLVMFILALIIAASAAVWIFMSPIFLLQLVLVAIIAYFASGGRLRWFYVALKTLPRDLTAIVRYVKLLWTIRSHEKKNRSVADVFAQYVVKHPNKICFQYEDKEWTFQQIEDYSNKIATIFKTHGYRKGDAVALLLENRPEFVAIWLGLSKLGVITPLINTNLRKASLLHSINVANCQALIYSSELGNAVVDIASSLDAKVSLYRFSETPNSNSDGLKEKDLTAIIIDTPSTPPVIRERAGYSDKLLYIYTSGTTGLPKAAVITNSRYLFIASGIHYIAGFKTSDKYYTPLPLYHTAGGIMSIGQALLHGSTVVIKKKFSASAYFSDCAKYQCTVAQYIGEMCRYILAVPQKPQDKEHSVRVVFGNGLRPQIWNEFVKRFNIADVAEFYGATEGNANIVNIDNTVGAIGFVSRIIPAVYPISIIKVDANGEPIRNTKGLCMTCEPNEPGAFIGKILPNNPTRAFLGYVDSKASKSKVVHDVFAKGDSAFISGDILVADEFGYLFFKDRTGDTYRWKGENVSTSEVEAVVSNLASYKDCVVYGVEIHGAEGRAGMAAIYDPDDTLNLEQLVLGMKEQLPSYARPQFIRALSKIDLTGTFKLKKKDLQEEGYDPSKIQDKLYYLDPKSGYQLLTREAYDLIQQGKIRL